MSKTQWSSNVLFVALILPVAKPTTRTRSPCAMNSGGRATLRERDAQLAQAREDLVRIRDEVAVRVRAALNKVERTRQMVAVSQELLATRQEARRVSAQQLKQGTYLRSQADATAAQEFEAQTFLLQSQLEYAQAQDELTAAIGAP